MILALIAATVIDRSPMIAHLAGITVGLTTVQQFEWRYGKGRVVTGGHPGGGRLWYDKTSGATIAVDGFYFSKAGEIIDSATASWQGPATSDVPTIHIPKENLGLLSLLRPDLSRQQVETRLRTKLRRDEVDQRGLVKFFEHLVNKDTRSFTEWRAEFQFTGAGLELVSVSAE